MSDPRVDDDGDRLLIRIAAPGTAYKIFRNGERWAEGLVGSAGEIVLDYGEAGRADHWAVTFDETTIERRP